jgi:hypothetical protein
MEQHGHGDAAGAEPQHAHRPQPHRRTGSLFPELHPATRALTNVSAPQHPNASGVPR